MLKSKTLSRFALRLTEVITNLMSFFDQSLIKNFPKYYLILQQTFNEFNSSDSESENEYIFHSYFYLLGHLFSRNIDCRNFALENRLLQQLIQCITPGRPAYRDAAHLIQKILKCNPIEPRYFDDLFQCTKKMIESHDVDLVPFGFSIISTLADQFQQMKELAKGIAKNMAPLISVGIPILQKNLDDIYNVLTIIRSFCTFDDEIFDIFISTQIPKHLSQILHISLSNLGTIQNSVNSIESGNLETVSHQEVQRPKVLCYPSLVSLIIDISINWLIHANPTNPKYCEPIQELLHFDFSPLFYVFNSAQREKLMHLLQIISIIFPPDVLFSIITPSVFQEILDIFDGTDSSQFSLYVFDTVLNVIKKAQGTNLVNDIMSSLLQEEIYSSIEDAFQNDMLSSDHNAIIQQIKSFLLPPSEAE